MRSLQSIQLTNLLSFGPDSPPVELGDLNVLIGANGSGKSNLIAAIELLRSLPERGALARFLVRSGGAENWRWKGASVTARGGRFSTSCGSPSLVHTFELDSEGEFDSETIEDDTGFRPFVADYNRGVGPFLTVKGEQSKEFSRFSPSDSVIAMIREPLRYPAMTRLGALYGDLRIYRPWAFPDNAPPRIPQLPTLGTKFLNENADNLSLILNELLLHSLVADRIAAEMAEFSESFKQYSLLSQGGATQLVIHEKGMRAPIPAQRLSDGTLRYLGLLAILLHPNPPPLICIEEPDLGLHPDIMPNLANLLLEASERTQLIVTTHSPSLVDAFSEKPECVLVCEKRNGSTVFERHSKAGLDHWLDEYSLGRVWRSGEIGGNRW